MANPNSSAQRSFAAEPYDSVAAVLASKQITAALAGQRIHTKDGFTYLVSPSVAVDWHVQTAGGAGLYVLPVGGRLHGRAFGATFDNSSDDWAALQKAFDAQASMVVSGTGASGGYTGSVYPVVWDRGFSRISKPLEVKAAYFSLEADDTQLMPTPDFTGAVALKHTNAFRGVISGVQVRGFLVGTDFSNPNTNSAKVKFNRCSFVECTVGALTDMQSTTLAFKDCLWRSCAHDIVALRGDHITLDGGWISRGVINLSETSPLVEFLEYIDADPDDIALYTGGIVLSPHADKIGTGGRCILRMSGTLGVPTTQTIAEPAWVAQHNNASFSADGRTRFGGETGSHAVVNVYTPAKLSSPIVPTFVDVANCDVFCAATDRAAIRLFDLPNFISIRDCAGFPSQRYVAWSATVDVPQQNNIIAEVTETRLSQGVFKLNAVDNVTAYAVQSSVVLPLIPDNLKFIADHWDRFTDGIVADKNISLWGTTAQPATYQVGNPSSAIAAGIKLGSYDFFSGDASGGSANSVVARVSAYQSAASPSGAYLSLETASGGSFTEKLRITASGGVVFIPRAAPSAPMEGETYFDSTTKKLCVWDGTSWQTAW